MGGTLSVVLAWEDGPPALYTKGPPSALLAGSQGLLECPVWSGLKHHQPDGSQLLKCRCQYQREDARQPLDSPENTVPTPLGLRDHSLTMSWLRALKGTSTYLTQDSVTHGTR